MANPQTGPVYEVFLSIKNPFEFSNTSQMPDKSIEYLNKVKTLPPDNSPISDPWGSFGNELGLEEKLGLSKLKKGDSVGDILKTVSSHDFSESLKAAGYDGVKEGNYEIAAFYSNQIKSASKNTGNFATKSNKINE
jgi:hypothetical protein